MNNYYYIEFISWMAPTYTQSLTQWSVVGRVYYSKGLDSGHAMYPTPDNIIHLKTIATTSTLE